MLIYFPIIAFVIFQFILLLFKQKIYISNLTNFQCIETMNPESQSELMYNYALSHMTINH